MKKLILLPAVLAMLILMSGCSKRYVTGIELALNQEVVNLPAPTSEDPLYFYVSIFSNTSWTCELDFGEAAPWCTSGVTSGNGRADIRMQYEKNGSGAPRTAYFIIRTSSKTCKLQINQP